jgi:integrase
MPPATRPGDRNGPERSGAVQTIDLDQNTIAVLDQWRQRLRRDGLSHGPDNWIFPNAKGRFLNPESISQLFDRIRLERDSCAIRFHDLRHTHASLLAAAGTPIKVVGERLGRAHPGSTIHTYQHLLPGMSAAAAKQFATLIDAATRQTSTGSRTTNTHVEGSHQQNPVDEAGDASQVATKAQAL